jgi:hypothetical protein
LHPGQAGEEGAQLLAIGNPFRLVRPSARSGTTATAISELDLRRRHDRYWRSTTLRMYASGTPYLSIFAQRRWARAKGFLNDVLGLVRVAAQQVGEPQQGRAAAPPPTSTAAKASATAAGNFFGDLGSLRTGQIGR